MTASGTHSQPPLGRVLGARTGAPLGRGRSLRRRWKILEEEEAFAQGAPSGESRCALNFCARVCIEGGDAVSLGTQGPLSAGKSIYFLPSFFSSYLL